MTTASIVHESDLQRTWRLDGNFRYDVAMSSIIIILNVAAILHMTMRTHKIPLDDNVAFPVICFNIMYAVTILASFMVWVLSCDDEAFVAETYIVERLGHTLGFCIFLCLLYCISHLALYICLPCLLWFVPAMIALCCPCLWTGEPAWWNCVKQPQSTVTIV